MATNTSGGTTSSFMNTPQAVDDYYDDVLEDYIYTFDVMANDLGGNAKILWSIDDTNLDGTSGVTGSGDGTYDLLSKDAACVPELSDLGAKIWIDSGKIRYDARVFNYLAANETVTDRFTYAIRLSNGTLSWATVTITITGTNDGPIVGAADLAGAVTEDASSPNLTDTGTISFDDVDLTNTHTTGVTAAAGNTLGGVLTASVTDPATGAGDGTVTWIYSVANSATQYLAQGQTATETFTIRISDNSGGYIDQVVVVTVTGTNDNPTVSVADLTGAATEDTSSPNLTDSGTITFDDLDLIDTHSTIVTPDAGNTLGGTLTASVTDSATGAGDGTVTWNYSVSNSATQYLAQGQTTSETFTVRIQDNNGGYVDQVVVVTVTGTNDLPDIRVSTGDSASASVDETNAGLTADGTLTVTDVDTTDVVSTTVALTNVSGPTGGLSNAVLLGMFSATPDSGLAANTGDANNLTWNFNSGSEAFNYLRAGQTLQLTYTLTVNDGNLGTDTQTVTITVTGTNDAPVLSDTTDSSAVLELDDASAQNPGAITGSFSVTDLDVGDTLTPSVVGSPVVQLNGGAYALPAGAAALIAAGAFTLDPATLSTGSAQNIGYSYDPGAADLDFLRAGDSLTITYTVQVGDGTTSSGTQTVTFTFTGTNDAPDASPVVLSAIAEDSGGRLITQAELLAGVTDVDNTTAELTITALSIATGGGTLVDNLDGTWTYTPALNDDTSVTFNYTVSDGDLSDNSTASLDITPVADGLPPTDITFTLATSTGSLAGGGIGSGTTLGSLSAVDPDSSSWTFTIGSVPGQLLPAVTVSPGTGGTVNLVTNAAIASGNYQFTVTATDAQGQFFTETYTLSVGTAGADGSAVFTITAGTDISFGLNGVDTINGGPGDDALVGGQNGDTLNGGLGNDQLIGGGGGDNFLFNTALNGITNVDRILDFDAGGGPNGDRIQLDDAIFTQLSVGTLSAANFVANAGGVAGDGNDYILYDTLTGNLYYDADGNGAGARVLFATITVASGTIDPTDILIV